MAPRRTTKSKPAPAVATKILSKKVTKRKGNSPPKTTRKRKNIPAALAHSLFAVTHVPVVPNPKDPLEVLDDLSFDLILQSLDVKDLLSCCAVSRLWRGRMDGWILNSQNRLRRIGVGFPGGLDPMMKPDEFLVAWKRKGWTSPVLGHRG